MRLPTLGLDSIGPVRPEASASRSSLRVITSTSAKFRPACKALEIASQVAGNLKFERAVETAAQGVKQGKGLARPLAETGTFPALSMHLLGVAG